MVIILMVWTRLQRFSSFSYLGMYGHKNSSQYVWISFLVYRTIFTSALVHTSVFTCQYYSTNAPYWLVYHKRDVIAAYRGGSVGTATVLRAVRSWVRTEILLFSKTAPPSIQFNPLKTESRLLYSKTQFVPRCKHFSSRLKKPISLRCKWHKSLFVLR